MNTTTKNKIIDLIMNNLTELFSTQTFIEEFKTHPHQNKDFILINNSFILRKPLIKTTKNKQFLMIKVVDNQPDYSEIFVATPPDFNEDFKIIKSQQAEQLTKEKVEQAIEREVSNLGRLLFFLIGEIIESPYTVEISNRHVGELIFDPNAVKPEIQQGISKKIIVVNKLIDPETAWNAVKPDLEKIPNIDLNNLEKAYAQAFTKMQNEARLLMNIPDSKSEVNTNTFIDRLHKSVFEQRKLYESALEKCETGQDQNDIHLREIMRISYNFADDAIKLLQLLVSVCDLKPIMLWATLKSHFDVTESIRNLPWTRNEKKASPEEYVIKINGARNRAFHNLMLFDRTIEANLSGIQVNAKKLTLLPLFSQRKTSIPLDYEDREIVEILSEITRANETVVSLDFWSKNLSVIKSFESLLQATKEALWLLNSAT